MFSDMAALNNIFQNPISCMLHRASYPMGTGALSPGVKRPGRVADRSPLSGAKDKSGGAIPPLPHMSSWDSA
jgi:hypothetical protein